MKRTRKDLECHIETLNKLLGGEAYFLEVLNREVYGPRRFRLDNKNGNGSPLCTWDRMTVSEMYQYLRAATAAAAAYFQDI